MVFFLQQNTQKSNLAQVELVRKLERFGGEHFVALVQEPYQYKEHHAGKPPKPFRTSNKMEAPDQP